jgi:hypothetical protein
MIIVEDFMNLDDYAEACGVTNRTILLRIKHHHITAIRIGQQMLIDIVSSPPENYINPHDKEIHYRALLPQDINLKSLIAIKDYIYKNKIRGHYLFEKAMANKIQSFIIGDIAFAYKEEMDAVRKQMK